MEKAFNSKYMLNIFSSLNYFNCYLIGFCLPFVFTSLYVSCVCLLSRVNPKNTDLFRNPQVLRLGVMSWGLGLGFGVRN